MKLYEYRLIENYNCDFLSGPKEKDYGWYDGETYLGKISQVDVLNTYGTLGWRVVKIQGNAILLEKERTT